MILCQVETHKKENGKIAGTVIVRCDNLWGQTKLLFAYTEKKIINTVE